MTEPVGVAGSEMETMDNINELRNKSVLVLCPKKLADNLLTYNRNLKTTTLVDSISGLDDFELISFLIIQPSL